MNKNTKEIAFEEAIENHLLDKGGYIKGKPDQFDPTRGLDPKTLIEFIKETQATKWQSLY